MNPERRQALLDACASGKEVRLKPEAAVDLRAYLLELEETVLRLQKDLEQLTADYNIEIGHRI